MQLRFPGLKCVHTPVRNVCFLIIILLLKNAPLGIKGNFSSRSAVYYESEEIRSSDSRHNLIVRELPASVLPLSLLMFRIFTDNTDTTFSLDDFALLTDRFY